MVDPMRRWPVMARLCGRAIPFCSGLGRRETKRKDLGPTIPFEHMPPVVCRAPNRPPPGGPGWGTLRI